MGQQHDGKYGDHQQQQASNNLAAMLAEHLPDLDQLRSPTRCLRAAGESFVDLAEVVDLRAHLPAQEEGTDHGREHDDRDFLANRARPPSRSGRAAQVNAASTISIDK